MSAATSPSSGLSRQCAGPLCRVGAEDLFTRVGHAHCSYPVVTPATLTLGSPPRTVSVWAGRPRSLRDYGPSPIPTILVMDHMGHTELVCPVIGGGTTLGNTATSCSDGTLPPRNRHCRCLCRLNCPSGRNSQGAFPSLGLLGLAFSSALI